MNLEKEGPFTEHLSDVRLGAKHFPCICSSDPHHHPKRKLQGSPLCRGEDRLRVVKASIQGQAENPGLADQSYAHHYPVPTLTRRNLL